MNPAKRLVLCSVLVHLLIGAVFAAQTTYIDETLTWSGYGTPRYTPLGPTNLVSPDNYRDGQWYIRFAVSGKPSTKLCVFQLCFWQDGWSKETCSACEAFSQDGVYYVALGNPNSWWKLAGALDWTRGFTAVGVMIKQNNCNDMLLTSTACGTHCYPGSDLFQHVPFNYDTDVILVSQGGTLVPPPNWNGCPFPECTSAPRMEVYPVGLAFYAQEGGANPASKNTRITNTGLGTLDQVSTSVSYQSGSGWITTTDPTTGGNTQTIVNNVDITGLVGGGYAATVTVSAANAEPSTVTYDVQLTVKGEPVLTSVVVTPSSGSVQPDATLQLSAEALDQDGDPLGPQPTFDWSVSGGGTIDAGLFTAGSAEGGPYTVTATATIGDVTRSGTASVSVSEYLLADDFDDNNYTGWTVGEGTWSASGGELANTATGQTSIYAGEASWTDVTLTANVTPVSGTDVWVIFRVQDASNYYLFTLKGSGSGALFKLVNGSYTQIASASGVTFSAGNTYEITVEVEGSSIAVYNGTTQIIDATDTQFSSGMVGFGSNGASGTFDNVVVGNLGQSPVSTPRVNGRWGVGPLSFNARQIADSGLRIDVNSELGYVVRIVDAMGRIAFAASGSGESVVRVPGTRLTNGLYLVNVEAGGRKAAKTMLIH